MDNKKALLIIAALGLVGVAAYLIYTQQQDQLVISPSVTAASTEASKITRNFRISKLH